MVYKPFIKKREESSVKVETKLEVQETKKPIPTVIIVGEIDHYNCIKAEAVVKKILEEGHRVLIIDLTQVSYMDTAGVSMIFTTAKHIIEREGELRLVLPPGNVRRILEIAGIDKLPNTKIYHFDREAREAS